MCLISPRVSFWTSLDYEFPQHGWVLAFLREPTTRMWHFAGTLASLVCFMYCIMFNWCYLFCVPLVGYGMAWYSHFFVERNVPATFGHPVWSFLCDYKMFGLMLTGQMDKEIKRLGKRPVLQAYWYLWAYWLKLGIGPYCHNFQKKWP